MTTTLKFLSGLSTTTTAMQAAASITLGLLNADLPVCATHYHQSLLDDCYLSRMTNQLEGLDESLREDLQQLFADLRTRLQVIYGKFAKAAASKKTGPRSLPETELKCKRKVSALLDKSLFSANVVAEGHLMAELKYKK